MSSNNKSPNKVDKVVYKTNSKSNNPNSRNKRQRKKKGKLTTLKIILMSFVILMFAIVGAGLGIFIGVIKTAPDVTSIDLRPQGNYTSFVYDADGNEIARFDPAENREYAKLSDIPLHLQQAVIATEDERFYEHNGIDMKGIFRAIVKNIATFSTSEGASTITQQLIKNNVLTSEKKFTRKIQEQYLAIEVEKLYDKDRILEYYLNTIGLSQGVNGVQAAANRYFGKDVNELTLTECVVIAGITQRPSYYDPIKHPENNWSKAQTILQKMEEQGFITAEEHKAALEDYPYDRILEVHHEYQTKKPNSYFVDALYEQLVIDLQEQLGCTEYEARNKIIYGGGLRIYSTQDSHMQAIVDKYCSDEEEYPSNLYKLLYRYSITGTKANGDAIDKNAPEVLLDSASEIDGYKAKMKEEWGIEEGDTITEWETKQPQPQLSFVLEDFKTGQIKALYGGRGDKTNLAFNYATQAKRQPGSTFKILSAYAPALDTGVLGPDSRIPNDHKTYELKGMAPYTPNNWDRNYGGTYTVTQAIANSMNVPAVETLYNVGIDTSRDYLSRFGITTLTDNDNGLAIALGGLYAGVTPLELNAAYSAIANDGVYVKPIFYTVVKDNNGNTIIDNTGEHIAESSHTVIKTSTAQLLTQMMQEVVDGPSKHTGSTVRRYFEGMPIAGKTGTTSDSKDLLFAGYTPYYAATVWTGYASPREISASNGGSSYHMKIWSKIMSEIHQDLEYKDFAKAQVDSSRTIEVRICQASGKRATSACEEAEGNTVTTEYFSSGNAPRGYCDIHGSSHDYISDENNVSDENNANTDANGNPITDIQIPDPDQTINDANGDSSVNEPSQPEPPVILDPEPVPEPLPEPEPEPEPEPPVTEDDEFAIPEY